MNISNGDLAAPDAAPSSDNLNSSSRMFACDLCDRLFARKHNLETHKLVHSRVKPHTCSVCKSGFKRYHDLRRHEKMHTGERPHTCPKCDKGFARADALLRHTKHGCAPSGATELKSRKSSSLVLASAGGVTPDQLDHAYYMLESSALASTAGSLPVPQSSPQPLATSLPSDTSPAAGSVALSLQTLLQPRAEQHLLSVVELLELKVKHLEKALDNDNYKMRNMESRLVQLEGLLLKKSKKDGETH